MPEIVNPYIAGNPVTGPEMFFGRADVFAFVQQALVGRHRDNVIILYGQRRTGKTSALYQMGRHLGSRYVCVFVDLHGLALEGLAGFLWELSNSIARTLRRDHNLELQPPPRAVFSTDPRSSFESDFLNRVWNALGERHLLLMLDEAIRLQEQVQAGKLEKETFEYLRYLMQHYPRLNFLFALGDGLEGMTKEYAFLFSVGLYKKISFLDRDSAVKLITMPVQEFYRVEPAARDRILQITAGHPYYTQLLCHSLFHRWRQTRPGSVQAADVDAVIDETVERGLAVLKHVWEESSPAEKALLAGVAAAIDETRQAVTAEEIAGTLKKYAVVIPPNELGQAYKSLLARDLITGRDRFRFSVDLQRLWILKYERLAWVRDELGTALRRWEAASAAAPPAKPVPARPAPGAVIPGRTGNPSRSRFLVAGAVLGLLVVAALLLLVRGGLVPLPIGQPSDPTIVAVVPTLDPAGTASAAPTDVPPVTSGGLPSPPAALPTRQRTPDPTVLAATAVFGSGVKIVYSVGTPGCSALGMMDLGTGQVQTFDPSPNNEEPSWSPDGSRFVASTGDCENRQYRLTLFDPGSGSSTPLDTSCALSIDPSWGKDGRIYFACGGRSGNGELFSLNPDGTDLRALGLSARRPTLSPDGKHLAYMRLDSEVWRIWVSDLDETGRLTNSRQMPFPQVLGGVFARQPKWNSDGTRLFFNITDQSSLQAMALASVELASGSTNVSFITPNANTPFVRPVCGQNRVCIAGGSEGGLWLLEEVQGSLVPRRQLTFGEEFGADVFP